MKAIDLFCGCGGLSAGLRDAGFSIVAGIDIEPTYIQTFTKNFPESESICADVTQLNPKDLLAKLGLEKGELDLLAGGPPCQGFSKNVPRSQRQLDSENNKLVKTFLNYCKDIYPKWVLMENVAEMRNSFENHYTNEIVETLTELGYKVIHGVHNAADYGVPQRRKRAFFIARRDGVEPKEPTVTHCKRTEKNKVSELKPHISVWDAIGDLRPLEHGEGQEKDIYNKPAQNDYQKYVRNGSKHVYNHIAKKLKPLQLERLKSLSPGQGIKELPENIRPKGGYSGAYGRLTEEMIMPTITRWVFHPGSGRWGHPRDIRLITIREAARLHGYKDNFIFFGSYTQQAGQLGNSVPPILAKKMGESFLKF